MEAGAEGVGQSGYGSEDQRQSSASEQKQIPRMTEAGPQASALKAQFGPAQLHASCLSHVGLLPHPDATQSAIASSLDRVHLRSRCTLQHHLQIHSYACADTIIPFPPVPTALLPTPDQTPTPMASPPWPLLSRELRERMKPIELRSKNHGWVKTPSRILPPPPELKPDSNCFESAFIIKPSPNSPIVQLEGDRLSKLRRKRQSNFHRLPSQGSKAALQKHSQSLLQHELLEDHSPLGSLHQAPCSFSTACPVEALETQLPFTGQPLQKISPLIVHERGCPSDLSPNYLDLPMTTELSNSQLGNLLKFLPHQSLSHFFQHRPTKDKGHRANDGQSIGKSITAISDSPLTKSVASKTYYDDGSGPSQTNPEISIFVEECASNSQDQVSKVTAPEAEPGKSPSRTSDFARSIVADHQPIISKQSQTSTIDKAACHSSKQGKIPTHLKQERTPTHSKEGKTPTRLKQEIPPAQLKEQIHREMDTLNIPTTQFVIVHSAHECSPNLRDRKSSINGSVWPASSSQEQTGQTAFMESSAQCLKGSLHEDMASKLRHLRTGFKAQSASRTFNPPRSAAVEPDDLDPKNITARHSTRAAFPKKQFLSSKVQDNSRSNQVFAPSPAGVSAQSSAHEQPLSPMASTVRPPKALSIPAQHESSLQEGWFLPKIGLPAQQLRGNNSLQPNDRAVASKAHQQPVMLSVQGNHRAQCIAPDNDQLADHRHRLPGHSERIQAQHPPTQPTPKLTLPSHLQSPTASLLTASPPTALPSSGLSPTALPPPTLSSQELYPQALPIQEGKPSSVPESSPAAASRAKGGECRESLSKLANPGGLRNARRERVKESQEHSSGMNPGKERCLLYRRGDDLRHVTAGSYIVMKLSSEQVVVAERARWQLEVASITKIMTCWVVIRLAEQRGLALESEWLTVSEEATDVGGTPMDSGTSADLLAGETYSALELLHGLMLPSGNDAAIVLAEHFGGLLGQTGTHPGEVSPVDLFVREMNRECRALGLKSTTFCNPHGLPSPGKSTSYDIARLTCCCLRNKIFKAVVQCKVYSCRSTRKPQPQLHQGVPSLKSATEDTPARKQLLIAGEPEGAEGVRVRSRRMEWHNTNRLLHKEGFVGVKTGATVTAGPCLVSAFEWRSECYITVVLRAETLSKRFKETRVILHWCLKQLFADTLEEHERRQVQQLSCSLASKHEDQGRFNYSVDSPAEQLRRSEILANQL